MKRMAWVAMMAMAAPAAAREAGGSGSTSPPAHEAEWKVTAGIGPAYVLDSAFDLVSSGAFPRLEVAVAYAPRWLDDRLTWQLGVALGWAGESAFQSWSTSFALRSLSAAAGYSIDPLRWLRLYGTGGLVVDLATLAIAGLSDAGELQDTAASAGVVGALGIELGAGEYFSLVLEGGYGQRFGDLRFDELAPDVEDSRPAAIAVREVDAGGVDLSGPFWKVGAALRF